MESKAQIIRSSSPALAPVAISPHEEHDLWSSDFSKQTYRAEAEGKYFSLVRRYWRPIALIMALSLVLSTLATLVMPRRYRAKSLVEVLGVNEEFFHNKDLNPNAGSSTMDTYVETQTKLLTSETVADRVVAALLPRASEYNVGEGSWARLKRMMGLSSAAPDFESVVRTTIGSLKVKEEGQSSLISIAVNGPTPQLAADVANAIANEHISVLQDARWSTATRTADYLTGQLDALRNKLQVSENRLQEYARANGLVYTADANRENVASEKLRAIQADLQKAEADRADKQAQLELLNSSLPETLPRVLDDSAMRENRSRLTDLRRQLANLSATLTPGHYKVKEVQSQIEELEKQTTQERTSIVARIQNDFKAAQRREQLQRQAYQAQLGLVSDQGGKEVRYNMLKSEAAANRDLYQSLSQKIKEASVVAALRASNIRVVDPAKAPHLPFQPNVLVNTAVGMLLGSMASLLFVLVRERADQSIRAPGESTRLLQVPELAVIPSARRDVRTQIVSGPAKLGLNAGSSGSNELIPVSHPKLNECLRDSSLVAESFRSAVTSILLWGREKLLSHKVLVITSAHPGAGKTTSVFNLGLGLAESGRRVLLIDGDLRLPRLGKIFGQEGARGLSSILTKNLPPTLARDLIVETAVPGLYLLPSGPRGENAPRLLHSQSLENLVESLRREFDFILIDSPPAIPLTDVRLLARHADGVILVVRAGETSAEQSINVRKCFLHDGTPVFGSILNDWNPYAEDPTYIKSYLKYAQPFGE